MPKSSLLPSSFPLVRTRPFHLVTIIYIHNLIAPSVPSHPYQHPHFHTCIFCTCNYLTSQHLGHPVQKHWSNQYLVEITFSFRWYIIITQVSEGKPLFHPRNTNMTSDIIICCHYLRLLIQDT